MNPSRQLRFLGFLAVVAVGSTSLWPSAAMGALNICPATNCGAACMDNADCNCNAQQATSFCDPASGAGGACIESADGMNDLCVCNPGFSPPNCASGACCVPVGAAACVSLGQEACQMAGGIYQGDNVSCTAVNCPDPCGEATAPECDGACPPGFDCVPGLTGAAAPQIVARGRTGLGECLCLPNTPTSTPTITPTSTPTATITATSSVTVTPTVTPTATATGTPTNTPVMEGGPCAETTDCEGGLFCEGGICTANTAPAPLVSRGGLMVIVSLLLTIGAIAFVRRRGTA